MRVLLRLPAYLRQITSDFLRTGRLPADDARGLLADENARQNVKGRPNSRQGRRLWKTMGILGLLISCAGLLFSKRPAVTLYQSALQEDHVLHILLPTQLDPVETCRTILSGAALNYPNLWAISWNVDDSTMGGADDLAKLESILAFLEIQDPSQNNDTLIVLANPKSWFQVRPEVLLKRYRSIQREHQRQSLRQNASRELYELQHTKARIVVSVEKTCLSKEGDDCLQVQAEDNTPRFVSHNFAIGPMQDLRHFYRDAVAEAKGLQDQRSIFDDHSIFARLYSSLQYVNSAPKDYSVALDLSGQLTFAATSDTTYADRIIPSTGLDFWKHRGAPELPVDIIKSEPPFASLSRGLHKAWKDLSFLTPRKAATVPSIVQQSAEFNSSLSQSWFERLWFHPHGKTLVKAYSGNPKTPLASFVDSDGVRQRFYSPHPGGVAAIAANKELHPWNEICEGQEFTSSLFVDGLSD